MGRVGPVRLDYTLEEERGERHGHGIGWESERGVMLLFPNNAVMLKLAPE